MASELLPELLQRVDLFKELTRDELEEVLEISEERDYPQGHVLFREGVHSRELHVILGGEVQISLVTPTGEEAVVATAGENDVVGESSFFHPSPHIATGVCQEPVMALRITRRAFDLLLGQDNVAALKIVLAASEILASRLQKTDRWIIELLGQHQDQQIASSWREFRHRIHGNLRGSGSWIHY